MILVDTSAWIHFLRPDGDPGIAACALRYGARVLAADNDFDLLRTVAGQLQRH